MPVESIEIRRNALRLSFCIEDQSDNSITVEQYTIRKRKPIDCGIYSLAHRDPEALLEVIDRLGVESENVNDRTKRFLTCVVFKLSSAFVAIGNSTES